MKKNNDTVMFSNHNPFNSRLLRSGLFEFKDEIDEILLQVSPHQPEGFAESSKRKIP